MAAEIGKVVDAKTQGGMQEFHGLIVKKEKMLVLKEREYSLKKEGI